MFLNNDEIQQLTGRKKRKSQIDVLRQRGIPFDIDGDGRPVVMECLLQRHMAGVSLSGSKPTIEPDFSNVA